VEADEAEIARAKAETVHERAAWESQKEEHHGGLS
jgi:hypothetical protein